MNKLMTTVDRALGVLAGGCDLPVRLHGRGEPTFVQARACGAYAYDEDGRRYIDYVMAYGPLLFGHLHPAIVNGLDELAEAGFVWGTTHPEELRLALAHPLDLLFDQRCFLRFVTTGTEAADGNAVRVARAFTRRALILKFAGNDPRPLRSRVARRRCVRAHVECAGERHSRGRDARRCGRALQRSH